MERAIVDVVGTRWVLEGAGVRLRRSIGGGPLDYLDPFLLLDHFGSDDPEDYLSGFPMHPHRGIETVTYMLAGEVDHRDTLGNTGTIGPGDVQWMTAGGGIMHEEMPRPREGHMEGFQLWVNLPAAHKMTAPRYREMKAEEIPSVERPDGVVVRVVAGEVDGVVGPVREIVAEPTYLDVTVPEGAEFRHPVPEQENAFAYIFRGSVELEDGGAGSGLLVFGPGEAVRLLAGDEGARLLLVAGRPLGEPIARYGPFVMTTQDEIERALRDLRDGTFVWRPAD